jgi:hypothetical protein
MKEDENCLSGEIDSHPLQTYIVTVLCILPPTWTVHVRKSPVLWQTRRGQLQTESGPPALPGLLCF